MDLRCKVFRATEASELESAVNRFLGEDLPSLGAVHFEEISQSEGPSGITITLWYSVVDAEDERLDDELEGDEELEEGRKELA
jgi:hypothetical protein